MRGLWIVPRAGDSHPRPGDWCSGRWPLIKHSLDGGNVPGIGGWPCRRKQRLWRVSPVQLGHGEKPWDSSKGILPHVEEGICTRAKKEDNQGDHFIACFEGDLAGLCLGHVRTKKGTANFCLKAVDKCTAVSHQRKKEELAPGFYISKVGSGAVYCLPTLSFAVAQESLIFAKYQKGVFSKDTLVAMFGQLVEAASGGEQHWELTKQGRGNPGRDQWRRWSSIWE